MAIVTDINEYEAIKERHRHLEYQKGGGSQLPAIASGNVIRWQGAAPPEVMFAIADLVPAGMVSLLGANGGAGKTLLMQTAATCVAANIPFLGKGIKSGRAAGIFAEDPDAVLHRRQHLINEHYNLSYRQLEGRLFINSYFGNDICLWRDRRPTEILQAFENQLKEIADLSLVLLDNVALLFDGNESDRIEVTGFVAALNGMAARLNCGVILSTHGSKSQDGTGLRATSGSTAWQNASRSVMHIEPANGEQPSRLTLIKTNHAKTGEQIELIRNGVLLVQREKPDFLTRQIRSQSIDDLIFSKVEEGWQSGQPYSGRKQARDRYLPNIIARAIGLKPREIAGALDEWIAREFIGYDRLKGARRDGLRILKERSKELPDSRSVHTVSD